MNRRRKPAAPPVDPQLAAIRAEVERVVLAAADLAERAAWPRAPAELKARVVVELAKTVDKLLGLADEFDPFAPWWVMSCPKANGDRQQDERVP